VALVVDRSTGLVSPQFLVALNPSFRTVKEDKYDQLWQITAGFSALRKDEVSTGQTSKESIYKKIPANDPEGASELQKPVPPNHHGEAPETHQREGEKL
jgi:hypothetical protein